APPPPDAARRPGAPPPAPVVRAAAPPPGGPPPPIYTAATRNSPTPSRLLSRLGERGPQVERHQRQKLLVVHIRDGALRSGPQDLAGQPLLVLDHPVDPLLHRAPAHQLVHEDVLLLPDAERAIGRLILDRRVPPPVEMDDVARRREVEPDAARLQRQDEERHPRVVLEPIAQLLAPAQLRVAVEDQPRAAEGGGEERRQRLGHLAELREHERLLLLGGDDLGDLAQALELAARLGVERAVAEPVRRMVADLLQAHEEREDHPAA